jgi:hypothetical protein
MGYTLLFEEIRQGRLAARKAGRPTFITIDDLDIWLKTFPKSSDFVARRDTNERKVDEQS